MEQTNSNEVIKLDRSGKILLLNILQQGFITLEQRTDIQKLLQAPLLRICYADSAEVVNELEGIRKFQPEKFKQELMSDCDSLFQAINFENDKK